MTTAAFELDTRLAVDTSPVVSLPLCDVLMMNDARYPWLVLVPRRAGLVELTDLDGTEQALLWQEVKRANAALRSAAPGDKLNLGVLGNVVRQLHVHIVVRREGDEAWPGPVWGNGESIPYAADDLATFIQTVKRAWAI